MCEQPIGANPNVARGQFLAYKNAALANETPRCRLERVALDLANVSARRDLFNRLSLVCRKQARQPGAV